MIGNRRPTAARRAAVGIGFSLALFLTPGCGLPGMRLSPERELELERRALDLLVRATQNPDGVVVANAIEAIVQVAPQTGEPHFVAALQSESPLVRYAALVALGEMAGPGNLADIRGCLTDRDPRVQLAAAFAAYRSGERDAARVLVTAVSDGPAEKLRADAAYLIGKLGEPRASKRLELAARQEPSGYVLIFIQTALARLGDDAMRDLLIQYVLKSDTETRLLALQSLVELADAHARPALLYRLNDDSEYVQTRLIAARALGRVGSNDGYRLAYESLFDGTADPNERMRIRSNAALALGAIGDRRALAALGDLAEKDQDPRTQVAACLAILQILQHGKLLPGNK